MRCSQQTLTPSSSRRVLRRDAAGRKASVLRTRPPSRQEPHRCILRDSRCSPYPPSSRSPHAVETTGRRRPDSRTSPATTASVRFINGSPSSGPVDVYIQSTGSAAPSAKVFGPLAYGEATDYMTEAAVAGNVITQTAGGQAPSTGAKPLQKLSDSVVRHQRKLHDRLRRGEHGQQRTVCCSKTTTTPASPQIRVHDASNNAYARRRTRRSASGRSPRRARSPGRTSRCSPTPASARRAIGDRDADVRTPRPRRRRSPRRVRRASASPSDRTRRSAGPNRRSTTLDSRSIFTPGSFDSAEHVGRAELSRAARARRSSRSTAPPPASRRCRTCSASGASRCVGYTDRL